MVVVVVVVVIVWGGVTCGNPLLNFWKKKCNIFANSHSSGTHVRFDEGDKHVINTCLQTYCHTSWSTHC